MDMAVLRRVRSWCAPVVAVLCTTFGAGCSDSGDGSGFADLEQNEEQTEGDTCDPPPPMEGKVVLGYLPSWVDIPSLAASLDWDTLTHVTLAFTNPTGPDGATEFFGVPDQQVHDLVALAHENGVKVMASIGGIAESEEVRVQLADDRVDAYIDELVGYLDEFDLDGVDVDIEGASVDRTYGPFVRKLAQRIRPQGRIVTAAVAAWFQEGIVDEALFCFDFINLMAYDAAGGWTGPEEHASQAWARSRAQYWEKTRGVDASRIVIGMPFYGYCWGDGCDSPGGQISFRRIAERYPDQVAGDWIYDEGITINFNGTAAIEEKTRFAQGYGGVMIWQMSQDSDDALLFGALKQGLR